jgi:hypothetical protein
MSALRYPQVESITVHPGERWNLDQQLPTALVYGQPIPEGVTVIESAGVTLGTIRLRFDDGKDVTCTLGDPPPAPQRWLIERWPQPPIEPQDGPR